MMKIEFDVREQTLRRKDNRTVAGNSIGFLRAGFEFDESWAGLTKIAVFGASDESAYDVVLGTDQSCECTVAHEAIIASQTNGGFFYVSVRGVDAVSDTTVRGTANRIRIELEASGALQGGNSVPATPSETEQLYALLAQGKWMHGTAVEGTGTGIEAEVEDAAAGVRYLNTVSGNVYECTAVSGDTSTWDYVMTLRGARGEQGEPGEPGKDMTHLRSNASLSIWMASVESGYAYALCEADITYHGTYEEYNYKKGDLLRYHAGDDLLEVAYSIVGEKGDKGDTGATGATGPSGDPGADGQDGIGAFYTQDAIRSYISSLPAQTVVYFLYVGDTDAVIRNGSDAIQYIVKKGDVTKVTTNTTTGWRYAFAEKAYSIIGEKGDDGFSPEVNVTTVTGGYRVTITDAEGDHTFDIMDGQSGDLAEAIANKADKGISETVTIPVSAWSALSASDPFRYSATATITETLDETKTVELINNAPVLFAKYGFQISAISGQNATIIAAALPDASVGLTMEVR